MIEFKNIDLNKFNDGECMICLEGNMKNKVLLHCGHVLCAGCFLKR